MGIRLLKARTMRPTIGSSSSAARFTRRHVAARMIATCRALLWASLAAGGAASAAAPAVEAPVRPTLADGDRVVLLGDTFFERDGQRGFVESALVAAHPGATIRFRNLGWSGDTVWADSRGVFDAPAKGYERMLALVGEIAPTVVFIAYGRNESEQGEAALESFRAQLAKLCDDVRRAAAAAGQATDAGRAPETVRLVLVTPTPFETVDADARNARLAPYAAAIRELAAEKRAAVVDLFAGFSEVSPKKRFTTNGVHLSDAGYAEAARQFVEAAGGTLPERFAEQSAELRRRVVDKNTLFFHRWRPANETYLFLFRKHEQGNNAAEMPKFDPLVEEAEKKVQESARQSEKRG